jgi:hypothetical protein
MIDSRRARSIIAALHYEEEIMSTLTAKARDYAINAHARINHRRKYTFQPYDVHLKAVADLVAMVSADEEIIAAAWLHDTVEDTPATFEDIEREFGYPVRRLVMELTDVSIPGDGNRATRKEIDRDHTAMASCRAKTIKLADLIDNCQDICRNDPKFGIIFLQEMVDLLAVLHEGEQRLYRKAQKTAELSARKLKIDLPKPTELPVKDVKRAVIPIHFFDEQIRRVLKTVFCARDIMNPLLSYDTQRIQSQLLPELAASGAKAIGVRDNGRIRGYLLDEDITTKRLVCRTIEPLQQVGLDAPLAQVIHLLTLFSCCFVMVNGEAVGVITRQDIEKPVVRMWLFGMITMVEIVLVKLIRWRWPDEAWSTYLSEGRIEKAKELQIVRRERGTAVDLLECLQFSDKLTLAANIPEFLEITGFISSKAARRAIRDLESLRNNLAHGQAITSQDWPPIARLARRIGDMF